MGARFINEVGGLLTVDRLRECSMEEGIFDVQLMDGPVTTEHDGEDGADRRRLVDGAECFVVVDAGLLREATEYPSGLVVCNRSIGVELVAENPLTGDDVGVGGSWNKGPCCVVGGRGTLRAWLYANLDPWGRHGRSWGSAISCRRGGRGRHGEAHADRTCHSQHAVVVRDVHDGHSARVGRVTRCCWRRNWSMRHCGR